jgi:SRSO17 transposase
MLSSIFPKQYPIDMMPIAGYPTVVEEFLPKVQLHLSKPQLENFAKYLTGLIVCDNKTVTAINNAFVGHKDQSALNNWLTDSPWNEQKLDKARKDLTKQELGARNMKHATLILDDTLNHKTGKHMEGANIHFDHAEGKHTLGHQIVTTHLAAGKLSIPVDFELYQRSQGQADFRNKNEIAKQLVAKAVEEGFCFDTVVFDVWYFNFETTSHVEGLGKDWVAGCKINRHILFNGKDISLEEYLKTVPQEQFQKVSVKTKEGQRIFWMYARNVTLRSHRQRVRVVFSYEDKIEGEPKVLACNRLNWDVKTILEEYLLRWNIDAFYRDAKQELGLEDYEVRKLTGTRRHWLMVFLADTLLQLGLKSSPLVEYVKGGFDTVGSTCRYAALEVLRSFVDLVMKLACRLKTADQILKYALSDMKGMKMLYQMES